VEWDFSALFFPLLKEKCCRKKQQLRMKKVIFRLESRFFYISIRIAQQSLFFDGQYKHF